jgi:hypothetical protein
MKFVGAVSRYVSGLMLVFRVTAKYSRIFVRLYRVTLGRTAARTVVYRGLGV